MDRQRDDRLGWIQRHLAEHRRALHWRLLDCDEHHRCTFGTAVAHCGLD
jgi:hypothetical protein